MSPEVRTSSTGSSLAGSKSDVKLAEYDSHALGAPITGPRTLFGRKLKVDLDAIATQASVFDDPLTLETYRPPAEYENAHRFDPEARWTWREETRIVRKIDLRIMIWAFVMFFCLDLDRNNISLANTNGFLGDLGMNTNDYNLGNTLFRASFLIAELPSQLLSKRIGPDRWIPSQIVLWSIVSLSQFWLSGRASFLATRFLLGFMQGGFIPDVVLYLSYFYTKSELPIRLAWFWISNYLSHIVGTLLGTAFLQLDGVAGKAGWRYVYLIEGCLTCAVGLVSFFMMPPGPTQTKAWFRPNGWFTERDEIIMVNRVLRDDPTKSSMHNREGLSPRAIFQALCDWRLWPLYALGITHMIPSGAPQVYLTLSLRNLGFSTTKSALLSIPAYVIGGIGLVGTAYLSEAIDSRTIATVITQIWTLPLLIALYTFNSQTSEWVYFAVVTLIVGFPYVHPIQVAWASRNSYSVRTRTVSASVYNMFVQAGAIIYNNIYRDDDKPLYKRGNRVLIAINCMNIALYAGTWLFYRTLNRKRDEKWEKMGEEKRAEYLEFSKDEGNKRLDFRFAY